MCLTSDGRLCDDYFGDVGGLGDGGLDDLDDLGDDCLVDD